MITPCLSIDLGAIEHNAQAIVRLFAEHGIAVSGVTKGACGDPEIAKAMLRGGIETLADSRLENIAQLRDGGIDVPLTLLRLPALSNIAEVVARTNASLNSEIDVVAALSDEAERCGVVHDVVLMVELGDLREGICPNDLMPFVDRMLDLPGVRLAGLGTNLACLAGVVPSPDNMTQLVVLAEEIESKFGLELELISGMNSSGLELLAAGGMPARVNHARIGEAILLGCETTHRRPWPGTRQDTFLLYAEILECKRKPSHPLGERAEDAFGQRPPFDNRGERVRALLNVGREDVDIGSLTPLDPGIAIVGASSGYLVADVTEATDAAAVGDVLTFRLGYGALLAAMTSTYVKKRFCKGHKSRAAEV
ncbi:MAG: alanine/ornithine racemase family PLP-dependent enzyme [Alphaproteobacteria bacterium]|nr:alanine/ornithine racemase family PLP-dependent enzyme [Alphaproteobacteria bacterium]